MNGVFRALALSTAVAALAACTDDTGIPISLLGDSGTGLDSGGPADCTTLGTCAEDSGAPSPRDSGTLDATLPPDSGEPVDATVDSPSQHDSGVDSGAADTGIDSTVDSGQDTGVDAAIDTGVDAEIDTGIDADIDSGTDSGEPCGDGGIVCASGCVDVETDPNNCGYCGVVCSDAGGSSCSGGICRMQAPIQTVAPVGFNIAVDSNYAYWSGNYGGGDLFALPLDGGTLMSLSSQGTGTVTVESGIVYWLIGNGLWSVSALDAGPSIQVASGVPCCSENLIASNGTIYLGGTSTGIYSVPTTGGSLATVYSGSPSSAHIAVANGAVYWSDGSQSIATVQEDGGSPLTLATGLNNPTFLAADATNVYWVENENPGRIMKLALGADAGSAVPLATEQVSPNGLAIDDTYVYWLSGNDGGSVWKAPIAGGKPIELATGQSALVGGGNGFGPIAVDISSVYWGNGNALVRLTPK